MACRPVCAPCTCLYSEFTPLCCSPLHSLQPLCCTHPSPAAAPSCCHRQGCDRHLRGSLHAQSKHFPGNAIPGFPDTGNTHMFSLNTSRAGLSHILIFSNLVATSSTSLCYVIIGADLIIGTLKVSFYPWYPLKYLQRLAYSCPLGKSKKGVGKQSINANVSQAAWATAWPANFGCVNGSKFPHITVPSLLYLQKVKTGTTS